MHNNKRFIIGAIAAALTFGGLKTFVGSHVSRHHHRPHWGHEHSGCEKWKQHHGCGEHGKPLPQADIKP